MSKPDPGPPDANPGAQGKGRFAAFAARRRVANPFVNFEYPNSLFGEILDWMLAPLLLLWPISIAATNHVAGYIANLPYDQHLADNVTAIVQLARSGRPIAPSSNMRRSARRCGRKRSS